MDLLAGFELFTRVGTALPEATIECVVRELRWGEVNLNVRVDRIHRALREQDCALFGAVRLVLYPLRLSGGLTDFRNIVRRRKEWPGIRRPSSLFVRSSISMPISDRYYPYVLSSRDPYYCR